MYDPWVDLEAHRLAGWRIRWRRLPGRLGLTHWPSRTTYLDPDQDGPQERCTGAHEVVHIERGATVVGWEDWEERIVDRIAARRLITLEDLVEGMLWAYDNEELAGVLWVDEPTLVTRLRDLTDAEGREIQRRLDEAEARFPDETYDDVAWSQAGFDWQGDPAVPAEPPAAEHPPGDYPPVQEPPDAEPPYDDHPYDDQPYEEVP